MKAPGDHQVKHEPEIAVNADGDALADATQLANGLSFDGRKRRIDRAQQKGGGQPHALEPLAQNARLKRCDVGRDVGQFRHCIQLAAFGWPRATFLTGGLCCR